MIGTFTLLFVVRAVSQRGTQVLVADQPGEGWPNLLVTELSWLLGLELSSARAFTFCAVAAGPRKNAGKNTGLMGEEDTELIFPAVFSWPTWKQARWRLFVFCRPCPFRLEVDTRETVASHAGSGWVAVQNDASGIWKCHGPSVPKYLLVPPGFHLQSFLQWGL